MIRSKNAFFFTENLPKIYKIKESDLREKPVPELELQSLNSEQLNRVMKSDFVVLIKKDGTQKVLKNRFENEYLI